MSTAGYVHTSKVLLGSFFISRMDLLVMHNGIPQMYCAYVFPLLLAITVCTVLFCTVLQVLHIRQVVSARTVIEEMSGAAEPEELQGTYTKSSTVQDSTFAVQKYLS